MWGLVTNLSYGPQAIEFRNKRIGLIIKVSYDYISNIIIGFKYVRSIYSTLYGNIKTKILFPIHETNIR